MSNKSSIRLIRSSEKCFPLKENKKYGKDPNLEILMFLVRDYHQINADGCTTEHISSNVRDQCETDMRSLHTPESLRIARLLPDFFQACVRVSILQQEFDSIT